MNDYYIVPIYTILDDILTVINYDDVRVSMSSAEILTITVIYAKYFQNHHERALGILYRLGYMGRLSVLQFILKEGLTPLSLL